MRWANFRPAAPSHVEIPAASHLAPPERPPGVSVAAWLDRALRNALDAGRVAPGARLPATRALARQLGLARGTVEAAYLRLADEGRVTARVGDGTRVQPQPPRPPSVASVSPAEEISPVRLARRADAWRATPFPLATTPPRAFRANQPSTQDFPLALWTRLTSRRLHLATRALLIERDPLGYLPACCSQEVSTRCCFPRSEVAAVLDAMA